MTLTGSAQALVAIQFRLQTDAFVLARHRSALVDIAFTAAACQARWTETLIRIAIHRACAVVQTRPRTALIAAVLTLTARVTIGTRAVEGIVGRLTADTVVQARQAIARVHFDLAIESGVAWRAEALIESVRHGMARSVLTWMDITGVDLCFASFAAVASQTGALTAVVGSECACAIVSETSRRSTPQSHQRERGEDTHKQGLVEQGFGIVASQFFP